MKSSKSVLWNFTPRKWSTFVCISKEDKEAAQNAYYLKNKRHQSVLHKCLQLWETARYASSQCYVGTLAKAVPTPTPDPLPRPIPPTQAAKRPHHKTRQQRVRALNPRCDSNKKTGAKKWKRNTSLRNKRLSNEEGSENNEQRRKLQNSTGSQSRHEEQRIVSRIRTKWVKMHAYNRF